MRFILILRKVVGALELLQLPDVLECNWLEIRCTARDTDKIYDSCRIEIGLEERDQ